MRPEIMPGHMEGHIETVCLSQFSRKYDKMLPAVKVENLVALTFRPVFLDDPQRNLQQPDCRGGICFFAPYMKPPRSVGGLRDVLIREPGQVGVGPMRAERWYRRMNCSRIICKMA